MSSALIRQASAIAAKYIKKSPISKAIYSQTTKIPSNSNIRLEGFYGSGAEKLNAFLTGIKDSTGTTAMNYINPGRIRSNFNFREFGMGHTTTQNIKKNWDLQNAIINDPKSWIEGKVGQRHWYKFKRGPKAEAGEGEWRNFTPEAKQKLTQIQKNTWGEFSKQYALNQRAGITPRNTALHDLVEKHIGEVIDPDDIMKLGISENMKKNLLNTWALGKDPKIMHLHNKSLNSLHRDIQYDVNFRDLVEIIQTDARLSKGVSPKVGAIRIKQGFRKFKDHDEKLRGRNTYERLRNKIKRFREKDSRKSRDLSNSVQIVDDKVVVSYSPTFKSNEYTGGINGKVMIDPRDPKHAYLLPSDAFDLYGKKFEWLSKNVFGMKHELLNVMGVKKIPLPDHRNWKTKKWLKEYKAHKSINTDQGRQDILDKARGYTPEVKSALRKGYTEEDLIRHGYMKPQENIIPPDQQFRYLRTTKGYGEDVPKTLDQLNTTPLPIGRYAKQAITTGLFVVGTGTGLYAGAKALTGNKTYTNNIRRHEDDDKYESLHAQARTEEHRFRE